MSELNSVEAAFAPVKHWYDGGEDCPSPPSLPQMIASAVEDLQRDRTENLALRKVVRACHDAMIGKVSPASEAWTEISQAKKNIPGLFPMPHERQDSAT